MKVHYDEGIANHIGPEPCAGVREGVGEASVGDRTGQPLSRERLDIPGADTFPPVEGETDRRAIASICRPGAVLDPGMYGRSLCGNWEISRLAGRLWPSPVRIGKARSRSRW